jgi:signal transduction histidine kinase
MSTADAQITSFELPLSSGVAAALDAPRASGLPEAVLIRNVLWFCRLRWAVIAMLIGFGALGLARQPFMALGLRPRPMWPFAVAAVLVVCNLSFLFHVRSLKNGTRRRSVAVNLWSQIVLDLLALTVVAHCAGNIETHAAFAYLFHIVLACIFFTRRQSLFVTVLACALFVVSVSAEARGLVTPGSIYADSSVREALVARPVTHAINIASVPAVWCVVWYLTSHLSAMLRERERDLAETNRRLVSAQEERARHMLRTTHELKAPFAAIHANTQLLIDGYCGELPAAAQKTAERIGARCARLTREIVEMLQLANLRTTSDGPPEAEPLDLMVIIDDCVEQARQIASERRITIACDLEPAQVVGADGHLRMLFTNLITNAALYSHPGGQVQVRCSAPAGGRAVVVIEDHGIGIPPEKLPRIFEEYYRTTEATQHNRASTGLGLAIVRHIAETHGIRVRVTSAHGAGTTFTLTFPGGRLTDGTARKEV